MRRASRPSDRALQEGRKRRRLRRRRGLKAAVVAGTAFFVPHAGYPAKPASTGEASLARSAPERTLRPMVGITTVFRLPPELAYERIIQEAAELHRLDPALIRAVIRTESAFDVFAVSRAGAMGLMQLMPALALELGVTDPFDPYQNILAGSRYLSALLSANDGDIPLALASYNAGPGAVARYHGIPPFLETEKYVRTIVGILETEAPALMAAQNALK
jgi:hypothetical protein